MLRALPRPPRTPNAREVARAKAAAAALAAVLGLFAAVADLLADRHTGLDGCLSLPERLHRDP